MYAASARPAARPNMLNPSRKPHYLNSRSSIHPMVALSNIHPEKQRSSEQPGGFCITYLKSEPVGAPKAPD
jgi:hypothetical protein